MVSGFNGRYIFCGIESVKISPEKTQIQVKLSLRIQTPPQNRIEGSNPILRIGM